MKKKFDIIQYIKSCIKDYDNRHCSRTYLIDSIQNALSKGSWQMHCDGKEVKNNYIKGFDLDGNPQTYCIIGEWCIEEED